MNDSIFRNVVETPDFALPSEENIGEAHKSFAQSKRTTMNSTLTYGIRVFDLASCKLPKDKQEIKEEIKSEAPSEHDITPIIFEECYVRSEDFRYVQQVKRSYEVTEEKITAKSEMEGFDRINDYVGVHLFVLQHGFQGNFLDMRLLKNNLSILHPDGIFLSCSSNEDQTEGDIMEMGVRLANEVK